MSNVTTRRDILAGNCPLLLDLKEVIAALAVTERKVDRLIAAGKLEDCVVTGKRRLFRAAQVRSLLRAV